MDTRDTYRVSRRGLLGGLALAGAAGLLGARPGAAAEAPPETRTIRLVRGRSIGCDAPMGVVEELLKAEGFTEIRWVRSDSIAGSRHAVASGAADLNAQNVGSYMTLIDAHEPVVLLAGTHVGCYELFASTRIRTMRDLKGKSVAVTELRSGRHLFLAAALRYIGLDAAKDVTLVTTPAGEAMRDFEDGKVDAFMAFPPEPQELRARRVGHVILNTTTDRPWSEYFCCMLAGHRDFIGKHPVATKRAMRAILKAVDVCALEPARVAQRLVDRGDNTWKDGHLLQMLKELPWDRWRTADPESTIRFHALRLHEAGLIKSSPQQIIRRGTDWRFLNEVKKEMKG